MNNRQLVIAAFQLEQVVGIYPARTTPDICAAVGTITNRHPTQPGLWLVKVHTLNKYPLQLWLYEHEMVANPKEVTEEEIFQTAVADRKFASDHIFCKD